MEIERFTGTFGRLAGATLVAAGLLFAQVGQPAHAASRRVTAAEVGQVAGLSVGQDSCQDSQVDGGTADTCAYVLGGSGTGAAGLVIITRVPSLRTAQELMAEILAGPSMIPEVALATPIARTGDRSPVYGLGDWAVSHIVSLNNSMTGPDGGRFVTVVAGHGNEMISGLAMAREGTIDDATLLAWAMGAAQLALGG